MDLNQQVQSISQETQIPVPPQQNSRTINEMPKQGSKLKLTLLIIILLIIVGLGAYSLGANQNRLLVKNQQITVTPTIALSTPTPISDPTINWKIYTSDKYGYEMKYPSDWNHGSGVMGDGFSKSYKNNLGSYDCLLNISMVDNSVNFEKYLQQSGFSISKAVKISNKNNIDILKQESLDSIKNQGIYATYGIENKGGEFSYFIDANIEKNIVNKDSINVSYGTVEDKNCIDTFDQMLSTFKFVQ